MRVLGVGLFALLFASAATCSDECPEARGDFAFFALRTSQHAEVFAGDGGPADAAGCGPETLSGRLTTTSGREGFTIEPPIEGDWECTSTSQRSAAVDTCYAHLECRRCQEGQVLTFPPSDPRPDAGLPPPVRLCDSLSFGYTDTGREVLPGGVTLKVEHVAAGTICNAHYELSSVRSAR